MKRLNSTGGMSKQIIAVQNYNKYLAEGKALDKQIEEAEASLWSNMFANTALAGFKVDALKNPKVLAMFGTIAAGAGWLIWKM